MRDPFDAAVVVGAVLVVVLAINIVLRFRAAAAAALDAAALDEEDPPSRTGLAIEDDDALGVLGSLARMKSNISLFGSQ